MRFETLEKDIVRNKELFDKEFSNEIKLVKNNLDRQMEILDLYLKVVVYDPYAISEKHTNMSLGVIYKNLLSIYAALKLTEQGLYGSARMIFRNIYEGLVISKTVAIKKSDIMLAKWENGEDINLRMEVFRSIKTPNSEALKEYWGILCSYNHATTYSQQVGLEYEDGRNEIAFNVACLEILLDMNYHVLNSYVANKSIQYYAEFMADTRGKGSFSTMKKGIRSQIRVMRKIFNKTPRRIVIDFSRKWTFKK